MIVDFCFLAARQADLLHFAVRIFVTHLLLAGHGIDVGRQEGAGRTKSTSYQIAFHV